MEYLLKSIACLLLFLLVHRLFLQQEVLHRFNRFFLLAAVILSFLIPLNQIEISSPKPLQLGKEEFSQLGNFPVNEEYLPTEIGLSSKSEVSSNWNWSELGFGIYILVSIVFLIRFLRNFQVLRSKIRSNIHINYRGQLLVLLPEDTLPYSFLKYIFVSKEGFEREGISDAVFEHERVHVVEKHSWDLIFVELLLIPFWFHPGLYWLRHAIRLNHEFIADRSAIQRTEITDYQYELIRLAQTGTPSALVSNLNYSLTKKRIQMMTKRSKPMQVAWKFLAVIPILGLIYYGFSEKVIAQNEANQTENSLEGVSYTLVYQSSLQNMTKAKYYSLTKFILKYPDGELVESKYDELPENLQNGLPDAPGAMEPKAPTAEQFESWKNEKEFALWLDGKVIPNSKLNEISRDEIVHYFSSFVHNNARSERFPQNYQVQLYREEAFENSFGEYSDLRVKPLRGTVTIPVDEPKNQSFSVNTNPLSLYQKEVKVYHEKLNSGVHFVEKTNSEQEELMEEFLDLGGKFFRLRVEDKKLTERPTHPFAPYIRLKKGDEFYFKLKEDLTEEERQQLPPPPPPAHKASQTQDRTTAGLLDIYRKMLLAYEFKKNELQHSLIENSPKRASFFEEFIKVQNAYLALDHEEKKQIKAPSPPSMPSRTAKGLEDC